MIPIDEHFCISLNDMKKINLNFLEFRRLLNRLTYGHFLWVLSYVIKIISILSFNSFALKFPVFLILFYFIFSVFIIISKNSANVSFKRIKQIQDQVIFVYRYRCTVTTNKNKNTYYKTFRKYSELDLNNIIIMLLNIQFRYFIIQLWLVFNY